jgi:hypothetical protein
METDLESIQLEGRDVYMGPEDITAAAQHLNVTARQFMEDYAASIFVPHGTLPPPTTTTATTPRFVGVRGTTTTTTSTVDTTTTLDDWLDSIES